MSSNMYTKYAKEYGRVVQDNIYNAKFERPTMLGLLPPLKGKQVLDLACGPGYLKPVAYSFFLPTIRS